MNAVMGSYNSIKGGSKKLLRIYSPLPLAARATHLGLFNGGVSVHQSFFEEKSAQMPSKKFGWYEIGMSSNSLIYLRQYNKSNYRFCDSRRLRTPEEQIAPQN
jgi:hypothetical protein